ncbi:amino acid permease-domain-containing protein [Desarmillaria tabescens]|uniref:Amino acid permease-domain-containing protein n=1 Tax=Armillaria tabescens TaxID=1929756 RepID=A0AA39NPA8_ARMTA|nr:amino acid permease-domain-containing protein [Desarmillaria tabescens]KAK0469330.1 amino acid permease-domain-containing protein [Desarmillaria tabescens]
MASLYLATTRACVVDNIEPPSFHDSHYDVIFRRQRNRPKDGGGLKSTTVPSRFLNLSGKFEFAGWGSFSQFKLDAAERDAGESHVRSARDSKVLGQFTASALAGNAVLGSVFYALLAVVAVASIYSPISLFIATMTLFLWRPIMAELGSALPITGAPYSYILNVSTKSFALISAALLLLDYVCTSVVSAATAATYLSGEVDLPFPSFVGAIIVLVLFTIISLSGIRESARLALASLSFHVGTMIVLMVASAIHWGNIGNDQLRENWISNQAPSTSKLARHVFDGWCLGMLGLTGFECVPAYIARIKPGALPLVFRNLHYPAIILNTLIMVLVMAVVPLEVVLQADNLLSVLAEMSAGRWLRVWVVVDAIIVLCGGVLTGILSACELFEKLTHDHVLPQLFVHPLPFFRSSYVSVLSFAAFSGVIYASTGASLVIMSKIFSLVWLSVMALFPLCLLLLKFNRGRLTRTPKTPVSIVFLTLAVVPTVFAGNIAIDPITFGFFSAYFVFITMLFSITQQKTCLLRWIYWIYDQYPVLQRWNATKLWDNKLMNAMTRLKRKPVCILAKTDEISYLMRMILYVQKNEETSSLNIIHFAEEEEGIPSELEVNARILDEAFPEITIDLIIVRNSFDPPNVVALAHRLQIPLSLMFMTCPGPAFSYSVADFGTRIVTL